MSRVEHVREKLAGPLTEEYVAERAASGWRPVAVEWERTVSEGDAGPAGIWEEVPYGLQVAADCRHLEENPDEVAVMTAILEGIVVDQPFSRIAEDLNRRGFRTRGGSRWTQTSVFHLLPRLIDFSPKVLGSTQWIELRAKLKLAV